MAKYIYVTGGVVSSLGKGIASASIGKILEWRGYSVALVKCDPYINVDPGTMNPYQHGEVYVTDDGAETDLDLGHYYRYTRSPLSSESNITTGKVYQHVINSERRGDFLGGTVQVIPHITDEIKRRIREVEKKHKVDIVIVEIGGTAGDIEGLPFLEAIRQMKNELGLFSALNIHLTLIPYIKSAGELKTKPTQHSVGKLREIGIQPEILLVRTDRPLADDSRDKIALFCNVPVDSVIEARDVDDIYMIPSKFRESALDVKIIDHFRLKKNPSRPGAKWTGMCRSAVKPSKKIKIGIVGKYMALQDAYKSIDEALRHAAIANKAELELVKIESENLEKRSKRSHDNLLSEVSGILVPGGFGHRGIEGKIEAARYARENGIPYFGICLGMQAAVIEFARNVCGLKNAGSTEFSADTRYPVISMLSEQCKTLDKGGTMRLGAYRCALKKGTRAHRSYGKSQIKERHRHRYEFNPEYREIFENKGMVISGECPGRGLAEIVELSSHPWFLAVQFHPEFRSRPDETHPLFREFIAACLQVSKKG